MIRTPAVRFLPGQRVFSFLETLPACSMHVSGGFGREYRAHFRRDFPTGQAYPNLWPYRALLGNWNIGGFPSDLFDDMQEELSEPGVISDDGQAISYTWTSSFLLEIATLVVTMRHGSLDNDQDWNFLFTDNVRAGFVLIQCNAYILDTESDIWQSTRELPEGRYSITAIGEFGGFLFDGPNPLIEMFSPDWSLLPPDEQNP